jgi:predicted ester cyclase
LQHIVAENDLVVVFLDGSGTHKGEFQEISPTDKSVNIGSADLYKIGDGKIVGHSDVVDQLNLLKQTGTLLSERAKGELKDARVVWIPDFEVSEVK